MGEPSSDLTGLLLDWSRGDQKALERLMPLVYDELRALAERTLRHERSGHTLQGTALVHEAYLKLVDQRQVRWQDRAHFFAVAAQLMRRILVDYARRHGAVKRGSGKPPLPLDRANAAVGGAPFVDWLALDRALDRLAALDERQARTVELRFFGGLTIDETAEVLQVSRATVKNDWNLARGWLFRELQTSQDELSARGSGACHCARERRSRGHWLRSSGRASVGRYVSRHSASQRRRHGDTFSK